MTFKTSLRQKTLRIKVFKELETKIKCLETWEGSCPHLLYIKNIYTKKGGRQKEEKMNSLPKQKEYEKDGSPTKIQVY